MKSSAGLILAVGDEGVVAADRNVLWGTRVFLSASEARAIVERGAHTMVNRALGIGIGVASVQGQLVTLLDFDPDHRENEATLGRPISTALKQIGILCEIESGEAVLVTGGRVIATGLYPAILQRDAVEHEGRVVELFSIGKLYRKVETRIWEQRALTLDAASPLSRRSEGRIL